MNRDDTLWKGILENVFDDFLRFFFKGEAEELFDFDKPFQFLDKELEQLFPVADGGSPKFVDKLVKVFTKTGVEKWVLVHVEVQGYSEKDFAKRMFTYFYRILDKYNKQVTAIAIFTDANHNFHPNLYEYDFLGTKNVFSFNTYKIIGQDQQALENNDNPFAVVILTVLLALKKKAFDDMDLLKIKLEIFRNLYRRNIPEKKRRSLKVFLDLYVRFAKPETNSKFDTEIQIFTKNKNTMGIEEMVLERVRNEGKAEGKAEAKAEVQEAFVTYLIVKMGLSDAQAADTANTTVPFVENIRKNLDK